MSKPIEEKVRIMPLVILLLVPVFGMIMMMQYDIKRYFIIIAVMAWYISSMTVRVMVNYGIKYAINGNTFEVYRRNHMQFSFSFNDVFLFEPFEKDLQREVVKGENIGRVSRFVIPLYGIPWVIGYQVEEKNNYLIFQPGKMFQKALEGKIKKKKRKNIPK